MARSVLMTFPLDTPILTSPGFIRRESQCHANSGVWYATTPDMPVERAKGNLGNENIPNFESRALSSPGAPFRLKR